MFRIYCVVDIFGIETFVRAENKVYAQRRIMSTRMTALYENWDHVLYIILPLTNQSVAQTIT